MPIKLEKVSYAYATGTLHERTAVRDVSLEVADGEYVGLMGKTGSGKSTLVQLMAGLIKPSSGRVLLDGEDINGRKYDRSILHRKVGLVFQHPENQLFETTVERDVAFGLKHLHMSKEEKAEAVKSALEQVGFDYEAVRGQSPLSFSGGEKRRIALAGVLAEKPSVLILDEPIAGLDPHSRAELLELINELNARGVTIVMISHSADVLAEYARRIIVLQNGVLIRDDSTKHIFSDYFDLIRHGLGVPQVRQTAQLLRERGVDMPTNVILYDQFIDRLKILLWRKSR